MRKIIKGEKLWGGKLGNTRYFCYSSMQKISRRALERFSSQKFHFEIFPKTNAISITFGPRYIHGLSLEEIDFPTRNAVNRFYRDSLLIHDCIAYFFAYSWLELLLFLLTLNNLTYSENGEYSRRKLSLHISIDIIASACFPTAQTKPLFVQCC